MPEEKFPPKPRIQSGAHVSSWGEYERLYRNSLADPEAFWAEQARAIDWFHPWHKVFDADYEAVDFAWFAGGRLPQLRRSPRRRRPRRAHRAHLGGR
jgi:acetyl-CoA synthetase